MSESKGRKFGYARVSTSQQSLEIQIETLKENGVQPNRILSDKKSGKDADREGLELLMAKVESGDQVLVTKLDRLGRNTKDMIELVEKFDAMGVTVLFLGDGISTDGPMGKMVITILAAVAEAERARILERTNEGRLKAKADGKHMGRKKSVDRDQFVTLLEAGKRPFEIQKELGISKPTYYRLLKELEMAA